jgi:hypothetical protein
MENMAPSDGLPPDVFSERKIPVEGLTAGVTLYRMHGNSHGPVYFGKSGDYRFDSPDRSYGVLYAAGTTAGCFVETLLREPGKDYVSESEISIRRITEIKIVANLSLAQLHGSGLYKMGATAASVSGDYSVSQAWSKAIHAHPQNLDGIAYRSVRDNSLVCYALFDRIPNSNLRKGRSMTLTQHPRIFGEILDRYDVALG